MARIDIIKHFQEKHCMLPLNELDSKCIRTHVSMHAVKYSAFKLLSIFWWALNRYVNLLRR